ncbi:phospholipase D family protein [Bacteroidota bacterium]
MLNIRHDRLNYGKLLAPPESFELMKAIGTSFSLDLYALLAIPVSLFYAKSMEGDFTINRYDVLDAIRRSKERVDIFCQRGKILVPDKYNTLLAFMEDCIVEVQPEIVNASFHPKIWVLRFENKEEIRYRLIVLSRNLTFDRSWDVAFFSDGLLSDNKVPSSVKLSRYLNQLYKDAKRNIKPSILKELEKVEFDIPNNFFDFDIFPIMPKIRSITGLSNPVSDFKYKDLLIISPFLNKGAIKTLKENNRNITLLSRQEELDKLAPKLLKNIDVYCMNELVANGEDYTDTEGHIPKSQNLHAKVFIGENKGIADWYMGSANCSSAAFDRNTEILVKMSSKKTTWKLNSVKKALFEDEPHFFIKYERSEIEVDDEEESLSKKIRGLIHHLCNIEFLATAITSEENENYTLKINCTFKDLEFESFTVKATIPHRQDDVKELIAVQNHSIVFENIAINHLSKYLILTIYYKEEHQKSILVKMTIDLPIKREDEIFNQLINSRDKFYQYLQFLLSPNDLKNTLQIDPHLGTNEEGSTIGVLQGLFGINTPIYEALMLAASRAPQKLKEIDKVITKLDQIDSEVVKYFLPIWTVFKEFSND